MGTWARARPRFVGPRKNRPCLPCGRKTKEGNLRTTIRPNRTGEEYTHYRRGPHSGYESKSNSQHASNSNTAAEISLSRKMHDNHGQETTKVRPGFPMSSENASDDGSPIDPTATVHPSTPSFRYLAQLLSVAIKLNASGWLPVKLGIIPTSVAEGYHWPEFTVSENFYIVHVVIRR